MKFRADDFNDSRRRQVKKEVNWRWGVVVDTVFEGYILRLKSKERSHISQKKVNWWKVL